MSHCLLFAHSSHLTCTISLLEPLGHFRRNEIKPSKGKKSKKRKHNGEISKAEGKCDEASASASESSPPMPEIAQYIDCGLSVISRTLQDLTTTHDNKLSEAQDQRQPSRQPYAAVFVARSGHPSAFHSHLPIMIGAASSSPLCKRPIRLVGFSKASEERLSAALGIPRVSSVGILPDAPHAKALLQFIEEHVPAVSASWMSRDAKVPSEFQPTIIETLQVPVGQGKPKRVKQAVG